MANKIDSDKDLMSASMKPQILDRPSLEVMMTPTSQVRQQQLNKDESIRRPVTTQKISRHYGRMK